MWMPDESSAALAPTGGHQEIAGRIVRAPQRQADPPGLFGGRPRETVLFRVELDQQVTVNCCFEGALSGVLDQGDVVRVAGRMQGGVMQVTRITDMAGAVIAQTACFVATVVYGDASAPEVERLRRFRDGVLRHWAAGRLLIKLYWWIGPLLANRLADHRRVCRLLRIAVLTPLGAVLAKMVGE